MTVTLSNLGNGLRVLYDVLFYDRAVEGSSWAYRRVWLDCLLRGMRGLEPRRSPSRRMRIRNRLGLFEVDLSNDG